MQKRLFLTGAPGQEKSALIRSALGERMACAGGFVMTADPGPDSFAEGYSLRPAAAAAGVDGLEARRFLDCRVWPPKKDTEVFRSFGVRLLEEASWYPFAVLDELGGIELLIPQFSQVLEQLLNSGLPLIGALKSEEETEQWRQLFGLGERFPKRCGQLRRALQQDPDTLILDLSDVSEAEALLAMQRWAELCT